jgi:hypothetical protein
LEGCSDGGLGVFAGYLNRYGLTGWRACPVRFRAYLHAGQVLHGIKNLF